MKRIALIAASAAAALTASLALAQSPPAAPGATDQGRPAQERSETRESRRAEFRQRMAERMQARMDERLTKLRADLKLKPDQVPLFDNLEKVIKSDAQRRREAWASMHDRREAFRDADLMERLDMMAGRAADRSTRLKELADSFRPLWTTLSDEQKTVARRAVRQAFSEGRERMERMRERFEERRGGWDRDHRDGDRSRGRDDRRG